MQESYSSFTGIFTAFSNPSFIVIMGYLSDEELHLILVGEFIGGLY